MDRLRLDKITLRKFGLVMGIAFLVISGVLFFRQRYIGVVYGLGVSVIFFIMGLVLPVFLKSIYVIWMDLAFILGWINTRIILVVLFYLIFTPMSLLMRLLRMDLLERKNKEDSYWKVKEKLEFNHLNYERRF